MKKHWAKKTKYGNLNCVYNGDGMDIYLWNREEQQNEREKNGAENINSIGFCSPFMKIEIRPEMKYA